MLSWSHVWIFYIYIEIINLLFWKKVTFGSPSLGYYENLLAFLSAIDNINQDPDILPNITLGFHLYDSWLEPRKAVQSVLQILSGPNGTIPNYSCKGQGKLAGVIGDQYSSTTIPIAQILELYRYTQVSEYYLFFCNIILSQQRH